MNGQDAAGPSPFEACSAARRAAERAPQGDGDKTGARCGRTHLEYWIPAEELDAFNAAIVGVIEVVRSFP